MKSNIFKIGDGQQNLEAILKETEKVAVYNDLTHKQAMQLRLLCEELNGMLPELSAGFEGEFWIEFESDICRLVASLVLNRVSAQSRNDLIGISKTKKNDAAVGFIGKLRHTVESMLLNSDATSGYTQPIAEIDNMAGQYVNMVYSSYWSMEQYKRAQGQKPEEAWDELEKSVITKLSDDVIVGIKGNCADIVVIKRFHQESHQ